MEDKDQQDVEEIKEKYEKLKKKYNLPNFDDVNKDFDIIKVDENSETMLRDIRKTIMAKYSSVLGFVELLLNPSGGSMFYMFLVNGIGNSEKEKLKTLFTKLGEIEIDSIHRDIEYDEEKEAEFLKLRFEDWKQIQPELKSIADSLKLNWKKVIGKKERSYFG